MAKILTVIEQREGSIRKASLEALSEARRAAAGGDVAAVLIGSGVEGLAGSLAAWGAAKVYVVDDDSLAAYSSEGYAAAAAAAVEAFGPDVIFVPATTMGKDFSGRLAAKLGVGCIPDVTAVSVDGGTVTAVRPVYSAKAFATVEANTSPVVVTLRPNVFTAEESSAAGEVEKLPAPQVAIRAKVTETIPSAGDEIDVAEADVIVSGGRGLKAAENFKLVEELAKELNGAVGASRAVVDAGWIEHSHQVGQTGKVVTPSLYIALGISGAIQHLAGMSSSKVIVAVNKDPEAPIFKVADYGVVGDLFQVVPVMTEEVKKLKG